ncbi:AraC family transcriptional regulator [marine bacterium AO1-C]|nr:AraC family transcriptional regulator [marine bacterium AO1-C]
MENIPIRSLTNKEPELVGSFSIRSTDELLTEQAVVQELHRHDFFFLLTLEKAKGSHEIDFIPYEVCDHSLYFMRPGQVHQNTLQASGGGYLMQFTQDFYVPSDKLSQQRLRQASYQNFYKLEKAPFQRIFGQLTHIFQEYSHQQAGYLEVIKSALNILFIELVRQNQPTTKDSANAYQQEKLEELQELLTDHITQHKQVGYYAEQLHLSAYQLNAITKTTLGKTCSELINEQIILEAKRYLLATSNQVNQIAWHLGYEDPSYFIRFFKKHMGASPEAFRKNFK